MINLSHRRPCYTFSYESMLWRGLRRSSPQDTGLECVVTLPYTYAYDCLHTCAFLIPQGYRSHHEHAFVLSDRANIYWSISMPGGRNTIHTTLLPVQCLVQQLLTSSVPRTYSISPSPASFPAVRPKRMLCPRFLPRYRSRCVPPGGM